MLSACVEIRAKLHRCVDSGGLLALAMGSLKLAKVAGAAATRAKHREERWFESSYVHLTMLEQANLA